MSEASAKGSAVAKELTSAYFLKSWLDTFSVTESLVLCDSMVDTKIWKGLELLVALIEPRAVVLWTAERIRCSIRFARTFRTRVFLDDFPGFCFFNLKNYPDILSTEVWFILMMVENKRSFVQRNPSKISGFVQPKFPKKIRRSYWILLGPGPRVE